MKCTPVSLASFVPPLRREEDNSGVLARSVRREGCMELVHVSVMVYTCNHYRMAERWTPAFHLHSVACLILASSIVSSTLSLSLSLSLARSFFLPCFALLHLVWHWFSWLSSRLLAAQYCRSLYVTSFVAVDPLTRGLAAHPLFVSRFSLRYPIRLWSPVFHSADPLPRMYSPLHAIVPRISLLPNSRRSSTFLSAPSPSPLPTWFRGSSQFWVLLAMRDAVVLTAVKQVCKIDLDGRLEAYSR